MKIYLPEDGSGVYHECDEDGALYSTYENYDENYIICCLSKTCCKMILPKTLIFAFDIQQSYNGRFTVGGPVLYKRNFRGQIIEMEDNFGDR